MTILVKNKFSQISGLLFVFIVLFSLLPQCSLAQVTENKVTSISWENNSLIVNCTSKVSYIEARLHEPERLVLDIFNTSLADKSLEKAFKSGLGESVFISAPSSDKVRIIFEGSASINRKSFLINNESTLVVRIARIASETDLAFTKTSGGTNEVEKAAGTIEEDSNKEPGRLEGIIVKEEDQYESKVIITASDSIKYKTYLLKNPDRVAVDLLNVIPSGSPLPKIIPTSLISSIRVGRAASGLLATRIVIDLAKQNLDTGFDTNLLGNKLEIKFKTSKEKEEVAKKKGLKVVIDPGHGGYDTGASYGGFEEKSVNLIISQKLKTALENEGFTVFLTREDDSFLSLAERVDITNTIKPDAFISIHGNAIVTSRIIRGVETYYWTAKSHQLAFYVHRSILSNVGLPDHFIRRAKFYVIKHISSPGVLAELGFLSNSHDRKLLTSSTVQDKYAKALTEALLKFLGFEPKTQIANSEIKEKKKEEENKKQKAEEKAREAKKAEIRYRRIKDTNLKKQIKEKSRRRIRL